MNDEQSIPQFLDEPERVLFWTVDEFLALMLPLMLGFLIGVFWVGLVIGPLACLVLSKIKQRYRGHFWAVCYWHLPMGSKKLTAFSPSHYRHLLG